MARCPTFRNERVRKLAARAAFWVALCAVGAPARASCLPASYRLHRAETSLANDNLVDAGVYLDHTLDSFRCSAATRAQAAQWLLARGLWAARTNASTAAVDYWAAAHAADPDVLHFTRLYPAEEALWTEALQRPEDARVECREGTDVTIDGIPCIDIVWTTAGNHILSIERGSDRRVSLLRLTAGTATPVGRLPVSQVVDKPSTEVAQPDPRVATSEGSHRSPQDSQPPQDAKWSTLYRAFTAFLIVGLAGAAVAIRRRRRNPPTPPAMASADSRTGARWDLFLAYRAGPAHQALVLDVWNRTSSVVRTFHDHLVRPEDDVASTLTDALAGAAVIAVFLSRGPSGNYDDRTGPSLRYEIRAALDQARPHVGRSVVVPVFLDGPHKAGDPLPYGLNLSLGITPTSHPTADVIAQQLIDVVNRQVPVHRLSTVLASTFATPDALLHWLADHAAGTAHELRRHCWADTEALAMATARLLHNAPDRTWFEPLADAADLTPAELAQRTRAYP